MKITQLLTTETIQLHLTSDTKKTVLQQLVNNLNDAGKLKDANQFMEDILTREASSSTGIGDGIAIPHAKSNAVREAAIAFGRSTEGIAFDSLDGQPAHLFFMIAAPDGANDVHLDALSRLASFLMDPTFRQKIESATTAEEIIAIIDAQESEKEELKEKIHEEANRPFIVAVTGCPTGIAHTYMAAEKLQERAEALHYDIKVETNGSSGVKNRLSSSEIEHAVAVIVAADTKIETDRFAGKPLIRVPVARAIQTPDELLNRAVQQDAPIHTVDTTKQDIQPEKKNAFYTHLMNGVSNMLPFVVGGGILIAISFFWGIQSSNPDDPSYNAFAAMLNTIGGAKAFFLMVPVLAGFIASSIADRPGFAPGMVGGLIAITVAGTEGASGGSGFLGGLIAGFLAGYVTLGVKKMFSRLPDALEGLKPVLFFPVFSIAITGIIMMLINPKLTLLYTSISSFLQSLSGTNQVIVGLLLGGMMAIDMGGPINKAAYTFGIAMMDIQNYTFIAAVMAGGMVPPLGIALATTMFKQGFTKQEREAGKTAYVLGASFITEGVIPFAAADPLRVIPASVLGAATAGGLSMLFQVSLPAPHGGIFVIGLIDGGITQILLYVLAILVGSFVTAFSLVALKKMKRTT
ncbi:MAG TPA: fructose-specific PTS transporter subunit EIIC [Savagea sp.]